MARLQSLVSVQAKVWGSTAASAWVCEVFQTPTPLPHQVLSRLVPIVIGKLSTGASPAVQKKVHRAVTCLRDGFWTVAECPLCFVLSAPSLASMLCLWEQG